jgi:hypothetical protein
MAVTDGKVVRRLGMRGIGKQHLFRTTELTNGRVILPVVNQGPATVGNMLVINGETVQIGGQLVGMQ